MVILIIDFTHTIVYKVTKENNFEKICKAFVTAVSNLIYSVFSLFIILSNRFQMNFRYARSFANTLNSIVFSGQSWKSVDL